VCFFFVCISKFFDRFKRLNDYKPTEDYKEAGIERLNNLSSVMTPLALARRNFTSLENTLMRPAEEQYMIMLADFEQSEFEKRLARVHEENRIMQDALRK